MAVPGVSSRDGFHIRPTAGGWALYRGTRHIYTSNLRSRVEAVMRTVLAKEELGAAFRRELAAGKSSLAALADAAAGLTSRTGTSTATRPRPPASRGRPVPAEQQRSSAIHEGAHIAAGWAMDYPVEQAWVHRWGPTTREEGQALRGFVTTPWPIRSEDQRADAIVLCLIGPVAAEMWEGRSLEIEDVRENPARFGAAGDFPEADRLARLVGPDMRRALTGESYCSTDELLAHLAYRAGRWLCQPGMERLVQAAASLLLNDEGYEHVTSEQIDDALRGAVPSWDLRHGRSQR